MSSITFSQIFEDIFIAAKVLESFERIELFLAVSHANLNKAMQQILLKGLLSIVFATQNLEFKIQNYISYGKN